MNNLIKEGRLKGQLIGKGRNAIFIPEIFSRKREEWITNFFNQNGFITYQTLSKMNIENPKQYLRACFSEGVALSSCFVSDLFLSKVNSSIEDALTENHFFDAMELIPSPLEESDAPLVLQKCDSLHACKLVVLDQVFVLTELFQEKVSNLISQYASQKAIEDPINQEDTVELETEREKGKKPRKTNKRAPKATQKASKKIGKEEVSKTFSFSLFFFGQFDFKKKKAGEMYQRVDHSKDK